MSQGEETSWGDDFGWSDDGGGNVAAMPAAPSAPPSTAVQPGPPSSSSSSQFATSAGLGSTANSVASMTDASSMSFSLLGLLGRGAFASCYLARDVSSSDGEAFVAVKQFTTPLSELGEAEEAAVRSEVDALKALSSHRNITTYHG